MQAAKQIRFSRNRRRSAAVRSGPLPTEPIHLKQNSALARSDGMFSMAANASARSSWSGM